MFQKLKAIFLLFLVFLCSFTVFTQEFEQFSTKEIPVTDTFYTEYIYTDKFRWLEKVASEETLEWIKKQNKFSKKYLSKIPKRNKIKNQIDKYSETDYTIPSKIRKYYYKFAVYNNRSTRTLMYKGSGQVNYETLVDPDDISRSDKIWINSYYRSDDESYLLYLYSRNGSDKNEARIISMDSKRPLPDYLDNIMFSDIYWYKDGFFYSTYESQSEFGITKGQKVLYHKVGTGQHEDLLIFERKSHPENSFNFRITHDNKFFVLTERFNRIDKTNVFYIDLEIEGFQIKPLLMNIKFEINILDSHKGKIVANSKMGTSSGVIFKIDPESHKLTPITKSYSGEILSRVVLLEEYIAVIFQSDHPILNVFDYEGNELYKLDLLEGTTAEIYRTKFDNTYIYFYFSSYTIPPVVYMLDFEGFEKELIEKTSVTFDFNNIIIKEMEYVSNDSVLIPMTIIHKKDLILDGKNPTLLSAYGGFGLISSQSFDPGIVYFIENGGVFAFAHIRGGGEKGDDWAKSGSGSNKQQSFYDFIAGAEYLIENNYTSNEKLASTGTSNGGLVVAAAAIQRPDLFKAVIPQLAPLDMLRYEKFTVGYKWVTEYGTINDSLSFLDILEYTPYQNIKEDVNYPSMLIITSTHDDRVPPFHSYKFAAALQNRKVQTNPILLKIENQTGHNGAITNKMLYDEYVDIYSFIKNALNTE